MHRLRTAPGRLRTALSSVENVELDADERRFHKEMFYLLERPAAPGRVRTAPGRLRTACRAQASSAACGGSKSAQRAVRQPSCYQWPESSASGCASSLRQHALAGLEGTAARLTWPGQSDLPNPWQAPESGPGRHPRSWSLPGGADRAWRAVAAVPAALGCSRQGSL